MKASSLSGLWASRITVDMITSAKAKRITGAFSGGKS